MQFQKINYAKGLSSCRITQPSNKATKQQSNKESSECWYCWNVANFEFNFFETYFSVLVTCLRRICPIQFQRVLDPEQIALTTVFQYLAMCRRETSYHLLDSTSVWRILRRIAKRRLIDATNRLNRTRSPDSKMEYHANVDNCMQPYFVVDNDEQLEQLRSLISKDDASTLDMLYAGYTMVEIASAMGITVRTVSRRRKRIQAVWISERFYSCRQK